MRLFGVYIFRYARSLFGWFRHDCGVRLGGIPQRVKADSVGTRSIKNLDDGLLFDFQSRNILKTRSREAAVA